MAKNKKKIKKAPDVNSIDMTGKDLVIVESPVKRRTVAWMLGDKYYVVATGGHFRNLFDRTPYREPPGKETFEMKNVYPRDVPVIKEEIKEFLSTNPPTKNPRPLIPESNPLRYLAVDIDDQYKPWYYITKPGQIEYICSIAKKMKPGSKVYLATDPDREGEGIAWHLETVMKDCVPSGVDFFRMVFHAVTPKDLKEAVKQAKPQLDAGLISAYRSREILDQIVGYTTSRALWFLNTKGHRISLSLGRVQVAALELLFEQEERAIQTIPKIGHTLNLWIGGSREGFPASLTTDEPVANLKKLKEDFAQRKGVVESFNSEDEDKWPRPSYSLAAFQRDMSREFHIGAKEALKTVQYLFESGACSYPRTDSPNLSLQGFYEMKKWAEELKLKTVEKPTHYKARSANAQESHEAIRPKHGKLASLFMQFLKDKGKSDKDFVSYAKGKITGFNDKSLKAFELIFRRALASVLVPAKLRVKKAMLRHEAMPKSAIEAESRELLQRSWYRIWKYENPETEYQIPDLKKGDKLSVQLDSADPYVQSIIRPSVHFLLSELDRLGIGRPSSTANMLDTLERRGYVAGGMSRFGAFITSYVKAAYADALSVNTTAEMDAKLNELAESDTPKRDSADVISELFDPILDKLNTARQLAKKMGQYLNSIPDYFENTRDKLETIGPLDIERDRELEGLLAEVAPNHEWFQHGSLYYATKKIANDVGFALMVWPVEDEIVVRLYWLYIGAGNEKVTGLISSRVPFSVSKLRKVFKSIDDIIEEMPLEPMEYMEAWRVFVEMLVEYSNGSWDLDGFFPTMSRYTGPMSINEMVFG